MILYIIKRKDGKKFKIKQDSNFYNIKEDSTPYLKRKLVILKKSNEKFKLEDYIIEKINTDKDPIPNFFKNGLKKYFQTWEKNLQKNLDLYPTNSLHFCKILKNRIFDKYNIVSEK